MKRFDQFHAVVTDDSILIFYSTRKVIMRCDLFWIPLSIRILRDICRFISIRPWCLIEGVDTVR